MTPEIGFGEWMRQRRKALDLTQEELGRQVGCAVVTVQKIETGQRRPSRQMAELLAERLQIPPGERGRFLELARAEPAVSAGLPRRSQLPTPLTSFIGRDAELEQLHGLLAEPATRLLTLTGPPGVGKTRLAIQAASSLDEQFPDGIAFIHLSGACDPELVLPTIAQALGFAQNGPQALLERLQRGLQGLRLLLVLDNFEQLLDAALDLAALLQACPAMKMLVTSRLALKLSGERLWVLQPLPLPVESAAPDSATADIAALESSAAVRLFIARVQAYQPAFRLNAANAAAVAEICAGLDGLPLAIELAAARLRMLAPAELAAQIRSVEQPLRLLGGGPRDLPERQQQLTTAIRWSYSLLPPGAQTVFRRVGVFSGGFSLAAYLEVCQPAGLDELAALVDHNLVRREDDGQGQAARYSLLETLRLFALEVQAQAGEVDELRRRHAGYFLAQAAPSGEHAAWLERCETDHDNLRLALKWLIGRGDARSALEMVVRLRWFWELHGYQREASTWLDAALALTSEAPALLRVQAYKDSSIMHWQLGEFELGRSRSLEALALCRAPGLQPPTAQLPDLAFIPRPGLEAQAALLWLNLARIDLEQGEFGREGAAVEAALETALGIYRHLDDREGMGGVLLHLGELNLALGDLPAARARLEQALPLLNPEQPDLWTILVLAELGELSDMECDPDRAMGYFQDSLAMAWALQHRRSLTLLLALIAGLRAGDQRLEAAERLEGVRLWGAVWALRNRSGLAFSAAHRRRLETQIDAARRSLNPDEWDTTWQMGQALSVDASVQLAQAFAT